MLKPSIPSKFIERIMTSQTGEQYRVIFLVTLINGEVKAKVISAQVISAPTPKLAPAYSDKGSVSRAGIFLLECSSAKVAADTTYVFDFTPEVSPFTSLLFFT
ncbi:MAG TPA: hypothetical protein VL335_00180, partial [Candidatus Paceibacterota bacterium]|nr:hypothetical protein [Candidatus Paceibacterota bacterium]